MNHTTDFLVIGSGLAGLNFSIKTARRFPEKTIIILTKDKVSESNTSYAQGGIAVVMDMLNDNFEKHKADTLLAGDGLCNEKIVEMVVREGPERLEEIIALGMEFDKNADGGYDLALEGAHSARRILHRKDITGFSIHNTLLAEAKKYPNIQILQDHFVLDLICEEGEDEKKCFGAVALNTHTSQTAFFYASATIIATGGAGQVYPCTTNPEVATGDGIAMAYRAKATLENMAFIQFHPTALFGQKNESTFLISEAVRGFGGILKDCEGRSFMEKYDSRGSLASRDIVARAIDQEMKNSGDPCVFLDCRHLDRYLFRHHFPNIYEKCISRGIDPGETMIPVAPAAHYFCGGVKTDEWGRTDVQDLYCIGEAASTGLHGANRLASNSLLEALVFSHRCFSDVERNAAEKMVIERSPTGDFNTRKNSGDWQMIRFNRDEVKNIMGKYAGIIKSTGQLREALIRIEEIEEETEQHFQKVSPSLQLGELRNLVQVAKIILWQSLGEQENRGAFYNMDLVERRRGAA